MNISSGRLPPFDVGIAGGASFLQPLSQDAHECTQRPVARFRHRQARQRLNMPVPRQRLKRDVERFERGQHLAGVRGCFVGQRDDDHGIFCKTPGELQILDHTEVLECYVHALFDGRQLLENRFPIDFGRSAGVLGEAVLKQLIQQISTNSRPTFAALTSTIRVLILAP